MGRPRKEFPAIMTVDEAAEFLRVKRDTVYDDIHRGRIPYMRVGRKIRIAKAALMAMLGCPETLPPTGTESGSAKQSIAS